MKDYEKRVTIAQSVPYSKLYVEW